MPTACSTKSMPRNKLPVALLSAFLLFPGIAANAQNYSYNLRFTVSPKNFTDTVSVEVERGRVYLPVSIGGQTCRFLLDTGASMGGVYADSPVSQGRRIGTIKSHDANGHTSFTDVICLPTMQIGQLTITGYKANVISRPENEKNADGIIGFDFFRKTAACKIDIRQGLLVLTSSKNHFSREKGYEAPFRLVHHVPYATLSPFSHYTESARFDTGDPHLYTISKQSFDNATSQQANMMERQLEGRTKGSLRVSHFGAEATHEIVALRLDRLQWGKFSFSDVRTLTSQGASAVGAGVLSYGAVIVNPKKMRLVFQPYADDTVCSVNNHLPDIYYIPRQGHPTVGLVWEYSEAYRQGFRQGDVILKIDDTPIQSFRQFMAYGYIAGQTYTYTVRDANGLTKLVKLTRK